MRNIRNKSILIEKFKSIIENLKFKSINLTFSKQLVVLWSLIAFISLFIPWIKDIESWTNWNSFYTLTWNIWFLLMIILFIPIFVILSSNYKEKIKLYSDVSFKNHFIIITSAIFIISFSIISISFVNWLHTFFENLLYWNWSILCMTWWFVILIWWLMIRKEYYQESSEIILNKLNQNREMIKKEDNMKLPF